MQLFNVATHNFMSNKVALIIRGDYRNYDFRFYKCVVHLMELIRYWFPSLADLVLCLVRALQEVLHIALHLLLQRSKVKVM